MTEQFPHVVRRVTQQQAKFMRFPSVSGLLLAVPGASFFLSPTSSPAKPALEDVRVEHLEERLNTLRTAHAQNEHLRWNRTHWNPHCHEEMKSLLLAHNGLKA